MPARLRLPGGGTPYTSTDLLEHILHTTRAFCWEDYFGANNANPDFMPKWTEIIGGSSSILCDNNQGWGVGAGRAAGVLRLRANAGTFQFYQYAKGFAVLAAGDEVTAETRLCFSAQRPSVISAFRLMDTPAQNYYEMYIGAAGNVFCRGYETGVARFNQDTGVGMPTQGGAWARWKIVADFAEVRFYIDDILVHTHALGVGLLNNNQFYIEYYADHAPASNHHMYVDWTYGRQVFSTPREP